MLKVKPTRWEVTSDTPGNERWVAVVYDNREYWLDRSQAPTDEVPFPTLRAALRAARKFVKEGEPGATSDS